MTLNKHPSIVRLLKVTLDRDNRLYLVFEYVPTNLYAVTQRRRLTTHNVREYMYAMWTCRDPHCACLASLQFV